MDVFPMIVLDSSTTSTESALDLFLRTDARASNFYKIHVNAWNTKEGVGTYFNYGSFEMYTGDSQHDPFIVPDDFTLEQRSKLDVDRFVICPNELREEAEADPILFTQEKCGISTSSSSKFFTDLKRLENAFNIEKFYDDMIIVDFFDPTDTIMAKLRDAVSQLPIDRKLYIKVDCGLTHDLYGFALGYGESADLVNVDGIPTERLKIKIPILFGLSRYAGQESSVLKIEDFILQIAENYDVAKVIYDSYQCFTGDTKISLLEGSEVPIKEIVERFNNGETMYTYTLDTNKGKLTAGKIINAWCTGKKKIIEVTLDNDEVIKCTEDHRFMMRDGSFREARYLKPEDSLMPLHKEVIKIKSIRFTDQVEDVYDLTIDNFPNFALSAGVFVHNSAELGQVMKQNGIEAERRYTDRSDSDYIIAKNYIYSGLVDIADNAIAYKEMSELERISPTKIDRIRDGISHKDLSDCIASLVGLMVETGPEEVLGQPESRANEDLVEAYQQLSNYRTQKYSSHGYISDYL